MSRMIVVDRAIARDRRIEELRAIKTAGRPLDAIEAAELDRLEQAQFLFWCRLPRVMRAHRQYLDGLDAYARRVRLIPDRDELAA